MLGLILFYNFNKHLGDGAGQSQKKGKVID